MTETGARYLKIEADLAEHAALLKTEPAEQRNGAIGPRGNCAA